MPILPEIFFAIPSISDQRNILVSPLAKRVFPVDVSIQRITPELLREVSILVLV